MQTQRPASAGGGFALRNEVECLERQSNVVSPAEGLRGTGGSVETLSAKRGTGRFAVTAGVFSVTYEPWSSRIFRSLTE
jgi:hypothetical protein